VIGRNHQYRPRPTLPLLEERDQTPDLPVRFAERIVRGRRVGSENVRRTVDVGQRGKHEIRLTLLDGPHHLVHRTLIRRETDARVDRLRFTRGVAPQHVGCALLIGHDGEQVGEF
jgi:hypothetical protein